MQFRCECGTVLDVPEEWAGKQGQCPGCESIVQIPGRPVAPVAQVAAAPAAAPRRAGGRPPAGRRRSARERTDGGRGRGDGRRPYRRRSSLGTVLAIVLSFLVLVVVGIAYAVHRGIERAETELMNWAESVEDTSSTSSSGWQITIGSETVTIGDPHPGEPETPPRPDDATSDPTPPAPERRPSARKPRQEEGASEEAALELFGRYVELEGSFSPRLADLYADSANIVHRRRRPGGGRDEISLDAAEYKELIRHTRKLARALGKRYDYADVHSYVEPEGIRITATRTSSRDASVEPFELLVGVNPLAPGDGKDLLILEETAQSSGDR